MTNRSKAKGTKHEVQTRDYLKSQDLLTERLSLSGTQDIGDLMPIDGWAVQCKWREDMDLAQAVDQAREQAKRADCEFALVVKHRNRSPASRFYAVMDLDTWVRVVKIIRELKAEVAS